MAAGCAAGGDANRAGSLGLFDGPAFSPRYDLAKPKIAGPHSLGLGHQWLRLGDGLCAGGDVGPLAGLFGGIDRRGGMLRPGIARIAPRAIDQFYLKKCFGQQVGLSEGFLAGIRGSGDFFVFSSPNLLIPAQLAVFLPP